MSAKDQLPACPPCPECGEAIQVQVTLASARGWYCRCAVCGNMWHHDKRYQDSDGPDRLCYFVIALGLYEPPPVPSRLVRPAA